MSWDPCTVYGRIARTHSRLLFPTLRIKELTVQQPWNPFSSPLAPDFSVLERSRKGDVSCIYLGSCIRFGFTSPPVQRSLNIPGLTEKPDIVVRSAEAMPEAAIPAAEGLSLASRLEPGTPHF